MPQKMWKQRCSKGETTKPVEMIRYQYLGFRRIYLSWDAAPWHRSKALHDRIEELNAPGPRGDFPEIRVLPLPGGAQFLNVIESVFSGMARAIIHNSEEAEPALAPSSHPAPVCYHPATVRPGRIHHAEA
jgi:hypothetical protein